MSAFAPTAGIAEVVELDEALDFDPPCDEAKSRRCNRTAEWIGRLSCCGFVVLACGGHRERNDRLVAAMGAPRHNLGPLQCGGLVRSVSWEPYRKGDR